LSDRVVFVGFIEVFGDPYAIDESSRWEFHLGPDPKPANPFGVRRGFQGIQLAL
jgi:hypothetical protein